MALAHRPLEDDDAPLICAFPQSEEELSFFFPNAVFPLTPQQLLDGAGEREAPTVALLNGQVAGYANYFNVRPNLSCTIGNVIVSPHHRRQGVATFLVNTMIQMAIETYGVRFVRAACFSHNTPAYQLYHGLRFKPAEMVPRSVPGGETVLLVTMELACHRR